MDAASAELFEHQPLDVSRLSTEALGELRGRQARSVGGGGPLGPLPCSAGSRPLGIAFLVGGVGFRVGAAGGTVGACASALCSR
jgi:hypothetical protein